MQHSYSWGFGLQGQRIPYWKRLLLQNAAPRGPAEGGLSILLNSEMLSKQSLCSGLGEAHRLEVLDCSLGSRPPQVPGLGCTHVNWKWFPPSFHGSAWLMSKSRRSSIRLGVRAAQALPLPLLTTWDFLADLHVAL